MPTQWTDEDREVFRHSVREALELYHSGRESYFDGLEPAEHVEHHITLRASAKRRAWLKEKLWDGVGDGIKRVVQVLVAILAVLFLVAIGGSAVSVTMKHWLLTLVGG